MFGILYVVSKCKIYISESVDVCSAIGNGSLFNGDIGGEFPQLIKDINTIIHLPFKEDSNDGTFKDIYTNITFNDTLFLPGTTTEHQGKCLAWNKWKKGAFAQSCDTHSASVCEGRLGRPYMIRGLCPESKIDKEYYPLMNDGRSNGPNIAVVQFIDGDQFTNGYYMLKNVKNIASAKIIARYVMFILILSLLNSEMLLNIPVLD